jgi:hypothetical protein
VRFPGALKRIAIAAAAIAFTCASVSSVSCGSGCKTAAECATNGTNFCCAGACVPDDASNCGKCGATCTLATACSSDKCSGSGASACAITEATKSTEDGACDVSASWKCIQGDVACHCAGSAGTCTCPSGASVDASFLCPSCDPTIADLTKVATLCNVSPPTP